MKTKANRTNWLVLATFLLAGFQEASAWYSPSQQRWLNRDPIEENGDINLYRMVQNNPVGKVDPFGLTLWKCSRDTRWGFDGTAQHVYLWDDTTKSSCARGGANPFKGKGVDNPGDRGPGTEGHTCVTIPNSDGKESSVMACCKKSRYGLFSVWLNDCHSWVDNCLGDNDLSEPSIYGRFWGIEDIARDIFR